MSTIDSKVMEETNASLLPTEMENSFGFPAPANCNQATLSRDFASKGPVADLLQPGLSPVFFTMQLATFRKYVTALTDETATLAVPDASLQDGVFAIALSVAHVGEPGGGAILSPDVASRIAVTVPLLAASYGFSRFQMWLGPALVFHRKGLSPREFWRRRLIPFLSLPVLQVPSPRTPSTLDFRQRLEALAASLGRGIFIASFSETSKLPSLRFVSSDGRTDCLRSRFQALLFSVATSALTDCTGACVAERALFAAAASSAFPSCGALLTITPVKNSAFDRMPPLWRQGIAAWLGTSCKTSQELSLVDVITSIRLQSSHLSIAIRNLFVRTAAGNSANWVVVTRDNEHPSVALIAIVTNNTVACSAAAALDSASDFLDLTADIDMAIDNEPFCIAVGDILSDAGLFSAGDSILDAHIVDDADDILLAKFSSQSTKRVCS